MIASHDFSQRKASCVASLPFAVVALALCLTAAGAADSPAPRPNIIIVITDDLGYGDLGCCGDRVLRTPNLDRFAAEGLRFTSCYAAAANCSPARTGLMTGRFPTRAGVTDWIPTLSPMHVRRDEITVATLLRRAGYATCLTGKWHLAGKLGDPEQPQPSDHGFDYWFATQNVALPSHRNPVNFFRNGQAVGPCSGYSAAIVADEAIGWLSGKRDRAKPFFLYVAFHEPHEPIATDPQFSEGYPFPNEPSRMAHHGNITQFDHAFGRLMRTLDEQKLRQSTFVFFTSDNGPAITPMHPHGSAGPLREKKGHLYEGGIRVPGILRWPGHTRPGTTSDEPISGIDFLPTLCALAGAAPPPGRKIDGVNFLPLLTGASLQRSTPLFWHFFAASSAPKVAMRVGDWKLLARLDAPEPRRRNHIDPDDQQALKTAELTTFELYNLRDDIAESRDLAAQEPQRVQTLAAQMTKLYHEVRDECPVWPAWTFANYEGPRIEWPPYWKPRGKAAKPAPQKKVP